LWEGVHCRYEDNVTGKVTSLQQEIEAQSTQAENLERFRRAEAEGIYSR
jgi:hypothetical protein